MKNIVRIATCFLVFYNVIANSNDSLNEKARVNKAIELIKIACVTGEKLDIEVSGDGGLSFIKKGVSGSFSFSKEEINGVIKGANQNLAKEENSEIRKCMQQYGPVILEKILGTKIANNKTLDENYYLTNQKIPVDIPVSILDGKPLLTVTKIYEERRIKTVKILVEIPRRKPYSFILTPYVNKWVKKSAQFEYRDIIYKTVVNYIDLQEQFATFTLLKYKDAN